MTTLKLKQPSARIEQYKARKPTVEIITRQTGESPRAARRRREKEVRRYLKNQYPVLFDSRNPVPLAIGIHKHIRVQSEWPWPQARSKALRMVLSSWVQQRSYRAAIAAPDSQRYDLDGSTKLVEEAHRQWAAPQLSSRQADADSTLVKGANDHQ